MIYVEINMVIFYVEDGIWIRLISTRIRNSVRCRSVVFFCADQELAVKGTQMRAIILNCGSGIADLWLDSVIFWSDPVIFWSDPVRFWSDLVMFWSDPVIF